MSGRPGGLPPNWSSTAVYPAGPEPWAGSPTKVNPGSALIAQGATPGDRLPAQIPNWLFSELGIWTSYQDTIEVRNYSDPTFPTAGSGPDLAYLFQDNAAGYDPTNRKFFLAGTDQTNDDIPLVLWSSNGQQWNDDSAPVLTPTGTLQTYQIVDSPDHGLFAWIRKGASSPERRRGVNGNWVNPALTTAQLHHAGRWFVDRWIIVGEESGPHPSAYSFVPTGTSGTGGVWTHLTLPGSSGVTLATIETMMIAVGGETILVVAPSPVLGSGTPQGNVWTSQDLGASFTHVSNPFLGRCVNVVWVEAEQLFWAFVVPGRVYTSADGTFWNLVFTTTDFSWRGGGGTTSAPDVGAGAALGGVVVQSANISTPDVAQVPVLAVGRNGGTIWDTIQCPINVPTFLPQPVACIQPVDNRLLLGRVDDPASNRGCVVSYSLRVK